MINTSINLYGIFMIISLVVYSLVVYLLTRYKKIDIVDFICSLVFAMIGIIVGAKFLSAITSGINLTSDNFLFVGMSSIGGAVGAILGEILYCLILKRDIVKLSFVYIVPLPIAYSIAKIGCFLVGCCYGIEYSGIGSIIYSYSLVAPNSVELFPVQLLETILNMFIFIFLMFIVYKKNYSDVKVIGLTFILISICKFLTDYLRYSHNGKLISINQVLCLLFLVLGLVLILKKSKRSSI